MTGYQEEQPLELGLAARTIQADLGDVDRRTLLRLRSARGLLSEDALAHFRDAGEIRAALERLRLRTLVISLQLDGSNAYVLTPLGIIVAKLSSSRSTRPLSASSLS